VDPHGLAFLFQLWYSPAACRLPHRSSMLNVWRYLATRPLRALRVSWRPSLRTGDVAPLGQWISSSKFAFSAATFLPVAAAPAVQPALLVPGVSRHDRLGTLLQPTASDLAPAAFARPVFAAPLCTSVAATLGRPMHLPPLAGARPPPSPRRLVAVSAGFRSWPRHPAMDLPSARWAAPR